MIPELCTLIDKSACNGRHARIECTRLIDWVFNANFSSISAISWQVCALDHGLKDYKIGIRCFCNKHGAFGSKSKDCG